MTLVSRKTLAACFSLALLAGCGNPAGMEEASTDETADVAMEEGNIIATLKRADGFSNFVSAVEAAGMTDMLENDGPYTVFAPTAEAFNRMDQNVLNDLMKPENKDALAQVVGIHVFEGEYPYDELTDGMELTNLAGMSLPITVDGDSKMIAGDLIVGSDIEASNGIIHVPFDIIAPTFD